MPSIQARFARTDRAVRVLQYGEGNFLRGFADDMIDRANESGLFNGNIVIAKAIPVGTLKAFREQDCLYTVRLRGYKNGEAAVENRVIASIADVVDAYGEYAHYAKFATLDTLRVIVSNTTEAGIVYSETDELSMCPPASFPGKLTKFLYERAERFAYAPDKGLIVLPVELIENNGKALLSCVIRLAERWELGGKFLRWLNESCVFASTLVDRIVSGFPRDEAECLWAEWGYEDRLIVTGEMFAQWVIESPKDISAEFPLAEAGLPVIWTHDLRPYQQRKVRVLNGAHTAASLAGFLCGHNTVSELMNDTVMRSFIQNTLWNEVIPTLSAPQGELSAFAAAVLERFANPFMGHSLLAIALNSVSKWRARCMPSLLDYVQATGKIPVHLAFSLAALMAFYTSDRLEDGALISDRSGEAYRVVDEEDVLLFFTQIHKLPFKDYAYECLGNTRFWGQDLTKQPGLAESVAKALDNIRMHGMKTALKNCLEGGGFRG